MTLLEKILLVILTIVVVSSISFIAYKETQWNKQQQEALQSMTEMKKLANDITRSQGTYATQADLENMAKENKIDLKTITDNLDKLNASLTGINSISAISNGQVSNNLPSSKTTPNTNPQNPQTVDCGDGKTVKCPDQDPYGYWKNRQVFDLDEKFGALQIPIGQIGFSAWQKNPWDIQVNERKYNVTNVLGTDENGKHYMYNKFTVTTNGKDYNVPITNAKFEEEIPSKKLRFNPQLFLGINGGIAVSKLPVQGSFAPDVSIGFFGYGATKDRNDFSILQVGVGYDAATNRPQAVVTPFAYNLGQNIPFVKNTYLTPASIAIETDGNVFIETGIRVGF